MTNEYSSLYDAFDRKRAKYERQQAKDRQGKQKDNFLDLTINPQQQEEEAKGKVLRGTIDGRNNNIPFFASVSEDKGDLSYRRDEYQEIMDRFEPMADKILEANGATILRSEITLTDSQGNNRTIVRRNDDDDNSWSSTYYPT